MRAAGAMDGVWRSRAGVLRRAARCSKEHYTRTPAPCPPMLYRSVRSTHRLTKDLGTYGASPLGEKPLWLARCRATLCNAGECGKIQRRPRAYAIPLTQVPVGPILVLQARCGLVLLLAYGPLPDTTCSPTIQCLMAHIGWTPPACFPRDMLLWLAKLWIPSNRHARDCFRRRATLGRIWDEVGGGSCFRVAAKIAIETA